MSSPVEGLRTLAEAINLVNTTLKRKGDAYGTTYRRVGLALSVPPQYSILVRMLEKVMRLDNLLKTGPIHKVAIAEEFLDLACYAVLGLLESSPGGAPDEWVVPEPVQLM